MGRAALKSISGSWGARGRVKVLAAPAAERLLIVLCLIGLRLIGLTPMERIQVWGGVFGGLGPDPCPYP